MNTTIIIRQIKEYTGAYGKAYTLLYLIGAVAILTSCVKDDLYDTPHPDRGAVVVTTDWSGKSTEADIPQAYTLRIGGREQNVSAATNVFDALLAPGGYGLTVYNSPEGISIDGNKATVNPVDLTGAIEPHPGYLFASYQDISVVADDTLHVTAPMRQYVRRLDIELTATEGDYSRVQSATATLSGVASAADMATGDRSIGDQNRVRLCQPITNGPITANRGFILSLRNIQRLAKGIENAVELFYLFCIHINQFESFYKSLHVLYSGRRWSRAYPL